MNRMLWLDYETYYDDEYSLSKMIRTLYLNDPRFKVHGCSFAIGDSEPFWVTGPDVLAFFKDVAPHIDSMCCHNGLFDHGITGKFFMPERKKLYDTMSMAQVAVSKRVPGQRMSLAKLAEFYFPDDPTVRKWEGILGDFKGVWQLDPEQEKRMAGYANQDNAVMREIYKKLIVEDVPWEGCVLEDINLTLGMGVYPQLQMNVELAAAINKKEEDDKNQAVLELNIQRAQLRSGAQFAELLTAQGVQPPMKMNPAGDKMIFAFAAKDLEFMALAEHPNPTVRALQALRIGEKSAQTMTRSATFASLPADLPIPLKVAAAHTGRHGGDEFNIQNLGRESPLRQCIEAPEGSKILVGDLSGIELRVNAWWCDEPTLLDPWKTDPQFDHYSVLSSFIFGRTITKADKDERFDGKVGELSCQYGAGEDKIRITLNQAGRPCDAALAKKIKSTYRSTRKEIVKRWKWLQEQAIPAMAGHTLPVEKKGVRFEKGRALLPSGRSLWYPGLRVNEEGDWVYLSAKKGPAYEKKVYGGALLENLIQAMSYDIFMFQQRLAAQYVKPLAMAVHDEGVFVFRDDAVAAAQKVLEQIYQCGPDWFRGVPIFGEFGVGQTYMDAK